MTSPQAGPRVCLCMIVRNEARVIERCLEAAFPAIDVASICDTGSDDGTPAIIRDWLARRGIPGMVHQHEFRNFAHNRTLSIGAAKATLNELGYSLDATHLLFLDADMELEIAPRFRRDTLRDDVYLVVQRNGTLEYPNVRLARASLDSRFVGATHEYFSEPAGVAQQLLDTLTIRDRNDGGSRSDKYERDRRLLEEELARDPGNVRAMFYLAQTCRGMGDVPRALFWYRRRVAAGGWFEEIWYAQLSIGLLFAEAGDRREAVCALIAAVRLDRRRPETYFHLAYVLRSLGRHRAALRIARTGLAQGFPSDRALFVDREICEWGLLREISINAFYTPERAEGLEANERLILGVEAPDGYAALASDNAVFYAEPLAGAEYVSIAPALSPEFAPCNPSILRTRDGYLVNCRAVSYRIDAYQRYSAREPDGVLRTRNFLIRAGRELQYLDQAEVRSTAEPVRETWVRGLEDARLFEHQGRFGFICTTTDLHPDGSVRPSLFMLDDGFQPGAHVPLVGYGEDRAQKNWLPFTDATTGELRAVYSYEPLVVVRIDPESGHVAPVVERRQRRNFGHFRGSAGPLDLPEESGGDRLILVHEVVFHGLRYYLHRFLRVDDEWNVTAASRPFFFLRRGIEFACGAAWSHDGEKLLITFGVEDKEAWLCRLPLAAVMTLLRPLPDWPPASARRAVIGDSPAG